MSMSKMPHQPNRPNKKEVTIDLLESIALEEMALANLLNAEAEKIHAFVGECLDFPSKPHPHEIISFNKGARKFVDSIIMKEWLLLKKLEEVCECLPLQDSHHPHYCTCHDDGNDC
ncbi:hypothetical protein IMZ31_03205 [Pontibacillus sp. ALD_SL1]|uniref:hypothetical protein n=1 Tax=Pontibacillus sp. ALD_SL1 TaxID=2777185 RepID=UPI001A969497|nr:hypothetical protein [Pontibacillus sp. ALD_SL1]QST00597.1 hypothetical protein IMZ31_03205 [Pontibacillus sp. ALD_SL1]